AAPLQAQQEAMAEAVKGQMKKLLNATTEGDADTIVAMTHPKALEKLGGAEKAAQFIKKMLAVVKARGHTFQVTEMSQPKVVKSKDEYYSVAPYTLVVNGVGKRVVQKTAVIGVSVDNGKSWKFVNLDAEGEAKVRQMMPDLPRELAIPKHMQTI